MKLSLRRLTANFWWKIASLVIAAALWFTLVGDPEMTTTIIVPVQYRTGRSDLEISSEVPRMVQLEIRGSSGTLSSISPNRTPVVLDLSGEHEPGERTFTITQNNVQLPAGVVLARAMPSQLRLQLDRRIGREVPVQVRFSGPPPGGYRIGSVTAFPDKVLIVGPESRVRKVDFVETDPVTLVGAVGVRSFRTHCYISDPEVSLDNASPVTIRVDIEKIPAAQTKK